MTASSVGVQVPAKDSGMHAPTVPRAAIVYGRTSGDEGDGQDVDAQVAQGVEDARAEGFQVEEVFWDEDVSGSVPPMDRPGFRAAVEAAQAAGAVLVLRDWSRFARMHPARAMVALDLCPVHVHVLRDTPVEVQCLEEQGPADAGLLFFVFFGPWQYRAAVISGTRAAMEAIRNGQRATRSGRANGRPQKVTRADVEAYYPVAVERGAVEAALCLSREKGWRPEQDPRTQKKYRVARTTLITAFQREDRATGGFPWPPEVTPDGR